MYHVGNISTLRSKHIGTDSNGSRYAHPVVIGSTDIPTSAVATVLQLAGPKPRLAYKVIGDDKWTVSRAKSVDGVLKVIAKRVTK